MSTCEFYTVWQGEHCANRQVPLHEHDCYELVYYQNGDGYTRLGEREYHFLGNTFALIAPHTPHNEVHAQPCRLICASFSCTEVLPCGVWNDRNGRVGGIVEAMLQESCRQEAGYRIMLSLLTQALTVQVMRTTASPVCRTEKSLEYAARYIEENYHAHIVFGTLADALHLSYSRFGHRFRELYGVSPQQYLIETRLATADRLLKNSTLTCTDIAYRCGFSTAAQFSALYKKRYGMPPRVCRTE